MYTKENLDTVQSLWREAHLVQDGVNSTAIAMGMHRSCSELMKIYKDTTKVNTHSVTQLWLYKLMILAQYDCILATSIIDDLWGELCDNYEHDIKFFKDNIRKNGITNHNEK